MRSIFIITGILLSSGLLTGQSSFDLLLKAEALKRAGDHDSAINILSKSNSLKTDSRFLLLRAESFMAKGDYKSAEDDYNAAVLLNPGSGNYGLSRIYAIRGDASKAITFLEKDMKTPNRKSEKDIMLDPAFSRIENSPEWKQFWKNEWFTPTEKILAELNYVLERGEREESERLISSMQREYPGFPETQMATSLYKMKNGMDGDAVKILSGMLLENPDNQDYLRFLAKAQSAMSNYAGASVTYSKLIGLEVPDAELFLRRAECYRKTGEFRSAFADVEKYLSLYPSDKSALKLAGMISSASGDNIGALKYYSENIRLHPEDADCYNDRANSYFISRSWDWAIKDYSMALDLDPGNSDVWLNKGISLLNAGNGNDACHDFRKAFDLGNKKATDYISRYCLK